MFEYSVFRELSTIIQYISEHTYTIMILTAEYDNIYVKQ
jgi:hypothetical protein